MKTARRRCLAVLHGMLQEAHEAPPEVSASEARTIIREGLTMHAKNVLPWVLMSVSLISAVVATAIIATTFTDENETFVHILLILVTSLTSVWALVLGFACQSNRRFGALVLRTHR